MSKASPEAAPMGWRDMDASELARQYNARGTVPDVDSILQHYKDASSPMYELEHVRDIVYGPHPDERLDLFPVSNLADAPLFVFIHGGYWRALHKEDSVFMAKTLTERGIAVASINYQLSPAASLEEIVAQCRRAIAWLYLNGKRHGVDTRRIVVAGSSAGAHLAAMLMSTGWQSALGIPEDVITCGVLVSGLYDLLPVQQTTPNQWLHLDEHRALALSPVHKVPPKGAHVCVVVAELDTLEFKRQSLDYTNACKAQGCITKYVEVAGRNHFDIIMDWMNPQTELTQRTLALIDVTSKR